MNSLAGAGTALLLPFEPFRLCPSGSAQNPRVNPLGALPLKDTSFFAALQPRASQRVATWQRCSSIWCRLLQWCCLSPKCCP